MILLQASRALRFAGQNARRNLWLSFVTTIIVAVAVFSVSLVAALNIVGQRALQTVEQRVDVTLELKPDVTEDQAQDFLQQLREQTNVKSATYLSKDDAFAAFKQTHSAEPNIQELLAQLTENPLPASITIKAKQVTGYDAILQFVDQSENAKYVADSKRDFKDSQLVIDRLTIITSRVRDAGIGVSAVFAILSLIVVINTIRIAIYTHREEIGIMRLVGASNSFIRAPFILESLIYSTIGAGLAILAIVLIWQGSSPALNTFFFKGTDVNVVGLLNENFWSIIGLQFLGAILLSSLSALFATRRYLKV
jgi:cell division transport system permease protein